MKLNIEHQFLLMSRGVMLQIFVIFREEPVKMGSFLESLLRLLVMRI
jgi:hypothetical protein